MNIVNGYKINPMDESIMDAKLKGMIASSVDIAFCPYREYWHVRAWEQGLETGKIHEISRQLPKRPQYVPVGG